MSVLSRHSLVQHQHEEDEDEHYQEQGHHTQTPPEHGEEEGLEIVNLNLSNRETYLNSIEGRIFGNISIILI